MKINEVIEIDAALRQIPLNGRDVLFAALNLSEISKDISIFGAAKKQFLEKYNGGKDTFRNETPEEKEKLAAFLKDVNDFVLTQEASVDENRLKKIKMSSIDIERTCSQTVLATLINFNILENDIKNSDYSAG